MRILLVEPPFQSFMHYDRWYYPSSLTQLAAIAHATNNEVVIYDADRYFYKDLSTRNRNIFISKQHLYCDNVDNVEHEIWQHFWKALEDVNPDVVGISIYTCKLKSALNTLKLVREFNPSVKICCGGAHVTALANTLAKNHYIDAVFTGYADVTFPQWIANGCPKGVIQGDSTKIDFTKLPYSRRQSLLFPENYTPKDLGHILASRGCIGRCTFCSNSFMWSGRPKLRTSASIRTELKELLDEWKVKELHVGDSSFSDIPKEVKRIAKIISEFDLSWTANVRWATVNRDLLEHFMDCGCNRITVGLESGSDKILKYMKKGCSKKLIREKAQIINSLGLEWHLFSIVGFPIETCDDMNETLELAMEIDPTTISINSLSPLPGTEIYKSIPDITPEFASTMGQLHPTYCFSEHMTLERYKDVFVSMTEKIEDHNQRKQQQAVR